MELDNKCLDLFKKFIKDIIKVYPEYNEPLHKTYEEILILDEVILSENEVLQEFLSRIRKLSKDITNKNESMFENEPLLLTDISFKNIWSGNISFKTKETIWKYLQAFCLLDINIKSSAELKNTLNEINDDKDVDLSDKTIASDVKKIKKMTENIQEPIAEDISTDNSVNTSEDFNSEPFESMMNSDIGKIAQEVSDSLNIEELMGDSDNPLDMIQNLMSGDGMSKIMSNVHSIVNSKVESGEINKDDMVNQAQGLYSSMNMDTNPLFQAMNQGQSNQRQSTNNPHTSSMKPTRQRLQKKLKEREQKKKVSNDSK